MKPGYVQVVACRADSGDCLEMSIWRGQAAEDEDAAERQHLRARGRPARPGGLGEGRSRRHKPRGGRPNEDDEDAVEQADSEAQAIHVEDSEAMELEEDADAAGSASEAGESDAELGDDGDEGLELLDALLEEMRAEHPKANAGDEQLDPNSVENPGSSSSGDSSSSSSSSSSTSSGSSTDSSDGEDEADEVVEGEGVAVPRAPAIAEHVFELEGGLGQIRYNVAQEVLIARCPVHGDNCRRRRAATLSPLPRLRGQGRPIGLLVSWLMRAHEEETSGDHVKMKPSPLHDRIAAREAFYHMEGGRAFAEAFEREVGDDETEEPIKIP